MKRVEKAGAHSLESSPLADDLVELRAMGLAYVRRHLPHRPADHEDLVQEALIGAAHWASRSGDVPTEVARRVTMAILKRRIADYHRANAREWSQGSEEPTSLGPVDPRQIVIARALRATVGFLADADDDDRRLVSLLVGSAPAPSFDPLSARDRKRLQRLRSRLREHLLETLGDSLKEILEDEPD